MAHSDSGCGLDHKHAAHSRRSRISLPRVALEREGPRTRGIPFSRAPPARVCLEVSQRRDES